MSEAVRAVLEAAAVRSAALLDEAVDAERGGDDAGRPRLLALGWGTVELERASASLAETLPGAGPFVVAPSSEALGGRCLVASSGLTALPRLVVLEPSTEGRLAAALARFGEGPVAAWFEAPTDGAGVDRLGRPGPLGRWTAGPFGLEALVSGRPVHGPHLLVVRGPAGTIRR
jgi:hypothetical protein